MNLRKLTSRVNSRHLVRLESALVRPVCDIKLLVAFAQPIADTSAF